MPAASIPSLARARARRTCASATALRLQLHNATASSRSVTFASSIDGGLFFDLVFDPVFDARTPGGADDEAARSSFLHAGCEPRRRRCRSVRFANAPPADARQRSARRAAQPARRARSCVTCITSMAASSAAHARARAAIGTQRALGVNALDEVPDSTWFTNRIGVRDMSPEELAAAPGGVGSPEPHKPWTIVSTKVGGMPGRLHHQGCARREVPAQVRSRGFPEAETATHVIVGKLLWAFGLQRRPRTTSFTSARRSSCSRPMR